MAEKNQFDKFINDICEREASAKKKVEDHQRGQDELPQRRYNRLYRERWQNSIRYGGR